jgi:glutathione S-transferase
MAVLELRSRRPSSSALVFGQRPPKSAAEHTMLLTCNCAWVAEGLPVEAPLWSAESGTQEENSGTQRARTWVRLQLQLLHKSLHPDRSHREGDLCGGDLACAQATWQTTAPSRDRLPRLRARGCVLLSLPHLTRGYLRRFRRLSAVHWP